MPLSALATFFPNFIIELFQSETSSFILLLPFDVLVEEIFTYLTVEDILCLRRTCKLFYFLTHEPIIWKRFLKYLKIPLPRLPPTYQDTLRANDFEPERIVTRAISLDDNWRHRDGTCVVSTTILRTRQNVFDLKLLPGGKFLVASTSDFSGTRHRIMLYALDHPGGALALATANTMTKAFGLQAKYVKFRGADGIMIAYIRRTFQDGAVTNTDPSFFGFKTDIDSEVPFRYQIVCLHARLDAIEHLIHPDLDPSSERYLEKLIQIDDLGDPFHIPLELECAVKVPELTFYELNGMPHLTIVQQPDHITMVDLTTQIQTTMKLNEHENYPGAKHSIRAHRMLPGQRAVIVIRTIHAQPGRQDLNIVELYEVPRIINGGFYIKDYVQRYSIHHTCHAFHITDYGIPTETDERAFLEPPMPISIYACASQPAEMLHDLVWPHAIDIAPTRARPHGYTLYKFNLSHVIRQIRHKTEPNMVHVLPGACRSLLYMTKGSDRTDAPPVVGFARYINLESHRPERLPPMPPDNVGLIMRKPRFAIPRGRQTVARMAWPDDLPDPLKTSGGYAMGLSAIAWDESIGRVCISAANDDHIQIVDYAYGLNPDDRFHDWKMMQGYLERSFEPEMYDPELDVTMVEAYEMS